jgi:outer membrane protein TolC
MMSREQQLDTLEVAMKMHSHATAAENLVEQLEVALHEAKQQAHLLRGQSDVAAAKFAIMLGEKPPSDVEKMEDFFEQIKDKLLPRILPFPLGRP